MTALLIVFCFWTRHCFSQCFSSPRSGLGYQWPVEATWQNSLNCWNDCFDNFSIFSLTLNLRERSNAKSKDTIFNSNCNTSYMYMGTFLTSVKGFLKKMFRNDTIWWYEKQLLMYAALWKKCENGETKMYLVCLNIFQISWSHCIAIIKSLWPSCSNANLLCVVNSSTSEGMASAVLEVCNCCDAFTS